MEASVTRDSLVVPLSALAAAALLTAALAMVRLLYTRHHSRAHQPGSRHLMQHY